jgi:hypothetical protein
MKPNQKKVILKLGKKAVSNLSEKEMQLISAGNAGTKTLYCETKEICDLTDAIIHWTLNTF